MKRWLPVAVVVVLLVIAVTLAIPWLLAPDRGAELVLMQVSGDVQVSGAEGQVEVGLPGQRIALDDRVVTGSGSSTAIIAAGEGVELSLSPNTDLRVTGISEDALSVDLDGGRLRAEVNRGGRALSVGNRGRVVRTDDGTFTVAATDGVFATEVERGTVQVDGVDGITSVGEGGGVTVLPDGSAARWTIPDEVFLGVDWPTERRTRAESVRVTGVTAPGALVTISGGIRPVQVRASAEGRFEVRLELPEGEVPVRVEVVDAFGRAAGDAVAFEVDRTPPTLRGRIEAPP